MKMKCSVKKLILIELVIFLIILSLVHTDLPVHCLADKIEGISYIKSGTWKIHLGENDGNNSITCGHNKPDQNLDHIHTNIDSILKEKYSTIVKIERPNKVLDIESGEVIGHWTMVYDEGFEFKIHSYTFFAFSKYSPNKSLVPTNTDTEDTPGYINECDKTFLGWFNNFHNNQNWGCFWAEQINLNSFKVKNLDYHRLFDSSSNKIVPKHLHNLIKKNVSKQLKKHQDNNDEFFNVIDHLNGDVNKLGKNSPDLDFSILNKNGPLTEIPEMPLINNIPIKKPQTPMKIVEPKIKIKAPKIKPKSELKKEIPKTIVDSKETSKNGPINSNLYDDFFHKFISAENEIPHLDIYYLNKLADNKRSSNENFLELDLKTKYFEPDLNYVNKINNPQNEYPWKAKVYTNFIGKTYSEMRNLLGNSIIDKVLNLNKASFLSFSEQIETSNKDFIQNTKKEISDSFPKKFDWRDVNGFNYDSPVRKQGECGSCYAISAITVLESRIRIRTGNKYKPILSPSSVISCSRYNQGCNGGYPYLVGKHAKEFGFVEERCQVYDQKDNYCNLECFNEKAWKANNYGYVGGYYGSCNEEKMMKEIMENGPIVVAINATPELYYYSQGIFISDVKKIEGKFEKNVKPWEYTNHAVVCIGWGEEVIKGNTVKFWILKNSWGDDWGELGYFRVVKGKNMMSVEAQGVYINPDISDLEL